MLQYAFKRTSQLELIPFFQLYFIRLLLKLKSKIITLVSIGHYKQSLATIDQIFHGHPAMYSVEHHNTSPLKLWQGLLPNSYLKKKNSLAVSNIFPYFRVFEKPPQLPCQLSWYRAVVLHSGFCVVQKSEQIGDQQGQDADHCLPGTAARWPWAWKALSKRR